MQYLTSFVIVYMFLSMTATTSVPCAGESLNILLAGCFMKEGEFLTSRNAAYYAVLQKDGNFVVYVSRQWIPRNALWSSQTSNKPPFIGPYTLSMQTDGNVVTYDSNNRAVWASQSSVKDPKPYYLKMQNDGNLVVYDGNGKSTWATGTRRTR